MARNLLASDTLARTPSTRNTLLGIGTPIMDTLYSVKPEFLRVHGLAPGSSNFVDAQTLTAIEGALTMPPLLEAAGDNARNTLEGFAILQRAQGIDPPSVVYAGRLAPDRDGGLFESSLRAVGIVPLLERLAVRTGRILCLLTPDKQRTFVVYPGQSEEYAPDLADLPASDWLYLSSISALCRGRIALTCLDLIKRQKEGIDGASARAHSAGMVAISLESPAMLAANQVKAVELAKMADVLFMNEEEAVALGIGLEAIAALAPVVFIKKGPRGSTVYEKGKKSADVPALSIQTLVDTTGAGDSFASGAIWGLSRGKSAIESARIGSRLGAAVVQKLGASVPMDFRLEP